MSCGNEEAISILHKCATMQNNLDKVFLFATKTLHEAISCSNNERCAFKNAQGSLFDVMTRNVSSV